MVREVEKKFFAAKKILYHYKTDGIIVKIS